MGDLVAIPVKDTSAVLDKICSVASELGLTVRIDPRFPGRVEIYDRRNNAVIEKCATAYIGSDSVRTVIEFFCNEGERLALRVNSELMPLIEAQATEEEGSEEEGSEEEGGEEEVIEDDDLEPEWPVVFDRLVDLDEVGSVVAFIASKLVNGNVECSEGDKPGMRYFRVLRSDPVAALVISTTNNFEEKANDEYLQVDFRFTGYSLAGLTPSDIEFAYKTLFGPYIEARDSVLAEGYDAYPVISDFSVYDSAKSKKRYACYSIEFPEKSGRLRRNVQIAL